MTRLITAKMLAAACLCAAMMMPGSSVLAVTHQQRDRRCFNDDTDFSPDLRISGCTAAIESGALNRHDLSAAHANRGLGYNNKQDYDRAIADLDEAIRLDPRSAKAFINRGVSYFHKKDYDRAIADYDEAIRLDPRDAVALANRGGAYAVKHDYDRAIPDLDAALRLKPRNAQALHDRGWVLGQEKDYDRAITDLDAAIRLDPGKADWMYDRGTVHAYKHDFDAAIADFDATVRLDPHKAPAFNNRGWAYLNKKDYDRAIADLDEAIRLDPRYSKAFINRGNAYRVKKDFDRAIADYSEAIRLDPGNVGAFKGQALAYEGKKNYDLALVDYARAVRLAPQDAGAFNGLCWAGAMISNLTGALEACNKALRLAPGAWYILDSRGLVELKLGAFDRAIADYSAAIDKEPKDASPLYGRGVARLRSGDKAGGDADIAAATALQADIADVYAGYGVSVDAASPAHAAAHAALPPPSGSFCPTERTARAGFVLVGDNGEHRLEVRSGSGDTLIFHSVNKGRSTTLTSYEGRIPLLQEDQNGMATITYDFDYTKMPPLQVGYHTTYHVTTRTADGKSRTNTVDLRVDGREPVTVGGCTFDTFVVTTETTDAADNKFIMSLRFSPVLRASLGGSTVFEGGTSHARVAAKVAWDRIEPLDDNH